MKKPTHIPRIGMRMIKTSIAVFLALLISYYRPGGMPIFSAITTILCMQPSTLNAKETGLNRIVGTIAGACFGLLTLLFINQFEILSNEPYHSLVLAFMVIPVIYSTILFKRPAVSAISAVTFMSVVIFTGDQSVYAYAFSRMIDTFIGIIISYVVNGIWLPRNKNKEVLFVTAFDEVLAGGGNELSNFTKVNLNRLLEDEAAITIATHRTPSTLLPKINDIDFKLPIIIMNGAAVYDIKKRYFPFHIPIESTSAVKISSICEGLDVQCYQYAIMHDELHVFCQNDRDEYEKIFHEDILSREYQSYIKGAPADNNEILYVLLVGTTDDIKKAEAAIKQESYSKDLNIIREDHLEREGYSNLEISSIHSSKDIAVKWLMEKYDYLKVVAFGAGLADKKMLKSADKSYLVGDSVLKSSEFKNNTKNIGSNEADVVIKKVNKLYYYEWENIKEKMYEK